MHKFDHKIRYIEQVANFGYILKLFRENYVRTSLIARGSILALLAGLFVGSALPSHAATLRVPKTAFAACAQINGIYCVESVLLKTAQGQSVPLMWVPNGNPVPQQPANAGISFAPMAELNAAKTVIGNGWWTDQYQRDVLTSGTAVFMDVTNLIGTGSFPVQGAKYDSVKKTFDTTRPTDSWTAPVTCFDPVTKISTPGVAWTSCFKSALVIIKDGEVKMEFDYTDATKGASESKRFATETFVDLKDLANTQQQPDFGAKYDPVAKTFSKLVPLVIPIWVTNNSLINGWDVAGTVTTLPSPVASPGASAAPSVAASPTASATATPAASPAATTSAAATPTPGSTPAAAGPGAVPGVAPAPLAPNASTNVAPPAEAGRALAGHWTTPLWNTLNLGQLGYDGLYVEAKAANEFSNNLFIDVLPTLTDASNKVNLASQPGSKGYALNLDPDITIQVNVRTGDMKTGVTVAVGVDTTVLTQNRGDYTLVTVEGSAVTVPLATDPANDCSTETGVAKANVRQFQTLIIPQNDQSGFGIDGTTGNLYVGSNGVCSLSTPTWDATNKIFSWEASAPHFAADGQTVNQGFYKAVIPFKDAALLFGLTNPADATTALTVSLSTQAGGTTSAISVISAKNNNIIIDVSGFNYSRPKLSIKLKKGYKPSKAKIASLPQPKVTVTCALGASTKKVTGTKPVCPKGFKQIGPRV